MQPNLKRMIAALAGVLSIAAVALLAMFLMRQAVPTQPAEFSQPPSNVTATTVDPNESQAPPQETVSLREPDAPREARQENGHLPGQASENLGLSLATGPASLDDNTVSSVVPSSTATVEEVADSFVPLSATDESGDDLSVFASPPVPEESHVSTYVEGPLPAAPESYVSAYLSGRASELLAKIRTEGAGLRLNAETLGTFAWNPQFSWQSHAFYLDRVKGHINAVGERLAELQQIRHAVFPWQQQAITEVTSHAAEVAASTQAAIIHLRENQNRLFVSEYRDHLKTIASRSEDMKRTVDNHLDYEKAQQEFQQLKDELEL